MLKPGFAGSRPGTGRGFTLLELLVALTLVVLAAAVALPSLVSDGGLGLRAGADTVAAGLRRARERALGRNEEMVLAIDLDRRRIVVPGTDLDRTLDEDLELSLVTARSERTGERSGRIRFFPDGSSTGGRVTLTRGEGKLLVDVDWLTGRVKVMDEAGDDATSGVAGRVELR